jgi:hypothetical protein
MVNHVILDFHGSECMGCHLECDTVLDWYQISFVLKVEVDFSKVLIFN